MNSLTALREIKEKHREFWARPVSWRGTGIAIAWSPATDRSRARFLHVPSKRPMDAIIEQNIFEEWELVSPDVVYEEVRY